jgi:hypothetical protein
MSLADLGNLLGAIVGFVLTLFVFSYLLGDNFLFRLAIHVFIGATAAYVAVVALYSVIWPRLLSPLLFGSPVDRVMALIPLVLSILLLGKATLRLSSIGSLVVAFLVGVGAAAAVGGAVMGTLLPQVEATMSGFDLNALVQSGKNVGFELFNGLIILIGAVSTLIYFQFSLRSKPGLPASQPIWLRMVSGLGQGFIAIAFGALFAGVYAAALVAMIERFDSLIQFILGFLMPAS